MDLAEVVYLVETWFGVLAQKRGAAFPSLEEGDGARDEEPKIEINGWTLATIILSTLHFILLLPATLWFFRKTQGVVTGVPRRIVTLNLVSIGMTFGFWIAQLFFVYIPNEKFRSKLFITLLVLCVLPRFLT